MEHMLECWIASDFYLVLPKKNPSAVNKFIITLHTVRPKTIIILICDNYQPRDSRKLIDFSLHSDSWKWKTTAHPLHSVDGGHSVDVTCELIISVLHCNYQNRIVFHNLFRIDFIFCSTWQPQKIFEALQKKIRSRFNNLFRVWPTYENKNNNNPINRSSFFSTADGKKIHSVRIDFVKLNCRFFN